MKLERKKNTIRSTIWGFIGRAVALLGPFIIRTIIIYTLGIEYLGLSSLFTSILQILSLAELGFSSAIAYSMYKPISNGDEQLICELLGYFCKVYKIVGIVIMAVGLMLLPFLKFFIHGDVPDGINIYWLYLLYLINSSISYFLFAYKSVIFSAHQREDIINKIYSFLLIIQYALQIGVLLLFREYYIYYVIVPVISVLNNLLIHRLSKKYYPHLLPVSGLQNEIRLDVKEKVSGVLISKFCGLTRNTFDSIIISSFLGLSTVAIYNNYYYISSNVASIIVIIVTAMRAGIGNSIAIEPVEKNYRNYRQFTFMYNWIAGWCTVCLLCLFQPFMKLWMGETNMFPFEIVIMICIYFYWQTMGDITNAYSGGAGLWWENRYRTITEAICNLLLNFIFGFYFGIYGIIWATITTIMLFNFFGQTWILYKHYFKEYKTQDYYLHYAVYNVVTVLACVITLLVCSMGRFGSVLNLLYRMLVCCLVPNLVFTLAYGKSAYFRETIKYAKEILRRK